MKKLHMFADFRGGLNTDAAPDKLSENELLIADNIEISDRGEITKARGFENLHEDPLLGNATQIFEWPRDNGEIITLLVIDGELCKLNEQTGELTVIDSVSLEKISYFFVHDKLYFLSGSHLREYNGTSVKTVLMEDAVESIGGTGSAITKDGEYLAIGSNRYPYLFFFKWDEDAERYEALEQITNAPPHAPISLSFTDDGEILFVVYGLHEARGDKLPCAFFKFDSEGYKLNDDLTLSLSTLAKNRFFDAKGTFESSTRISGDGNWIVAGVKGVGGTTSAPVAPFWLFKRSGNTFTNLNTSEDFALPVDDFSSVPVDEDEIITKHRRAETFAINNDASLIVTCPKVPNDMWANTFARYIYVYKRNGDQVELIQAIRFARSSTEDFVKRKILLSDDGMTLTALVWPSKPPTDGYHYIRVFKREGELFTQSAYGNFSAVKNEHASYLTNGGRLLMVGESPFEPKRETFAYFQIESASISRIYKGLDIFYPAGESLAYSADTDRFVVVGQQSIETAKVSNDGIVRGSPLTSVQTDSPVHRCKFALRHTKSERYFYAGNPDEQNALYYSDPGEPGRVKKTNRMFPTTGDGPITGLVVFVDAVLVSFKNSFWAWRGIDPEIDAVWHKLPTGEGTIAPHTICTVGTGLMYLGARGIINLSPSIIGMNAEVETRGQSVHNVTENKLEKLITTIRNPEKSSAAYDPNTGNYLMTYADDSGMKVLVLNEHFAAVKWTHVKAADIYHGTSGRVLASGANFAARLSETSSGFSFPVKVQTLFSALGSHVQRKLITKIHLMIQGGDEGKSHSELDIEVLVDREPALNTLIEVAHEDGLMIRRRRLRALGNRASVKLEIETDQDFKLYGVGLEAKPVNSYGKKV